MKKLVLLLLALLVGLQSLAMAAPAQPVAKEAAYLLGMYYGNGSRFLIRENQGRLELVYAFSADDKDFSGSNIYPLKKEHFDSYTLNEEGPIMGTEVAVRFERNEEGKGILCKVGGKRFNRYFYPGENNNPFVIKTTADYDRVLAAARAAAMPARLETGTRATLVDLAKEVPGVHLALQYALNNNIFGRPLYTAGKAYAASEVAAALTKAQASLRAQGFELIIWEAYRPWFISKVASDLLPKDKKTMLPLPEQGEDRNTGLTVDVSLYDPKAGGEAVMPGAFDEISPRQYAAYAGGTTEARHNLQVLTKAMEQAGFTASKMEWWHFTLGDPKTHAHLNQEL